MSKWVKPWSTRTIPDSAGGSSDQSPPGSARIPPSMPLSGRRVSQIAPSRSIHQATPCRCGFAFFGGFTRSEEHTTELPVTNAHLVCRLLHEKKKPDKNTAL